MVILMLFSPSQACREGYINGVVWAKFLVNCKITARMLVSITVRSLNSEQAIRRKILQRA